jgi:hypothetical protein
MRVPLPRCSWMRTALHISFQVSLILHILVTTAVAKGQNCVPCNVYVSHIYTCVYSLNHCHGNRTLLCTFCQSLKGLGIQILVGWKIKTESSIGSSVPEFQTS